MSNGNNKHTKPSNKKEDGKFNSKHINHNQNAESARAVFGLKNTDAKNNSGYS